MGKVVIPISLGLVLVFAIASLGCAGARPALPEGPVDISYVMGGRGGRISALRGRPLVLALVRISELTSDVFIGELKKAFSAHAGRTRFLVLTIEPNEAPMLGQYAEFNELPFEIGTAGRNVAAGRSALGPVPIVPTLYLIDEGGRVVDMSAGAVTADRLSEVLRRRRWR